MVNIVVLGVTDNFINEWNQLSVIYQYMNLGQFTQ